ncbi:MAG: DUF4278 domain-containing protein [Desmonostoc vinosum HA7617-LM4]|jgi:hypothetical protein|nr:DUF4278 domain-containing protein [Desmonostoc vinosum HA7617-LM4]
MKLYYRGLSYEYDPSKQTKQPFQTIVRESEPAYNLMYRGISYHVNPNIKSATNSLLTKTHKLIYRGITYLVNKTVQAEVNLVSQPANTSKIEMSVGSFG